MDRELIKGLTRERTLLVSIEEHSTYGGFLRSQHERRVVSLGGDSNNRAEYLAQRDSDGLLGRG